MRTLHGFSNPGRNLVVTAAILVFVLYAVRIHGADLDLFQKQTDVGKIALSGSVEFRPNSKTYRITGSGANLWNGTDAFHFVWKRSSGDLAMECAVEWVGAGKNAHRKAGWMVRESLAPDAPYADAVVHGDGLIAFQFRKVKGGETAEVQSSIRAPAVLRFERNGNVFTFSIAKSSNLFQPVGSLSVVLPDSVYAGLAVCSHDASVSETAVFSNVRLEERPAVPQDKRRVESTLETVSIETGERRIVHRAPDHFEAPNWILDGKTLLFNSKGRLYTVPADGGSPALLNTGFADRCNNDHGLSPDGKWLAVSHSVQNQSLVYVLPSGGGDPRLVTRLGPSYWHGWSPDGRTLVYCAQRNREYDVYSISVEGGEENRLTSAPGLDDGSEYSPDGNWIYFNSERTGLMKIWRMKPDGAGQEPVTFDSLHADWFPHPSPDGKWIVFLSYDKSVKGHPANRDVTLRIMPASGGEPRILAVLFGGQGTLNVPSWSPDGKFVAFVSYRLLSEAIR